ncbi:MAG TPA: 1,4-alpha-glucan branching protein domain-containing protein [Candidatus Udaeobacter sp.]|nr:1,4-alpha-glucan branching protein domain-containing protein [Candidatus Udaeobacter sp.]
MGYLALILHAHLPFVRHPEHEHFLEEEWLFEAITETYVPLLRMMQRLTDDGVPFKLTMSITPTLCAMLEDPLLRERYVRHVELLIDLAARERKRNRKDPQFRELADFYFGFFSETRRLFVDEWKCNLLSVFRELQQTGALEIIASAATHGLLPILQQQSARAARAQVLIGRDVHVELFGREPAGFWLPECGYALGLEGILQETNLRWFVLDAHGLIFGTPCPRRSMYAPCYTAAGPAAFARDPHVSRQVWSAQEGYPGDPVYREFYRDIGFDLPFEHLGPIMRGTRKFSGVKYHRITKCGVEKQLYDRAKAEKTAAQHAIQFLEQGREQIQKIGEFGFEPIVVAPFDAELFGHWWFEGPIFLEQFIREAAKERDFRLTVPSEYLAAHPTQQIVQPAASTWGENGHLAVWLDPSNAWIYSQLQSSIDRMTKLAQQHSNTVIKQLPRLPVAGMAGEAPALQFTDRVLKQLARELLLAQSSDWAFLMKTGTARDYATQRTIDHFVRFNRLHDQFVANSLDEEFLGDCEWRDNIFPNVNWHYYA